MPSAAHRTAADAERRRRDAIAALRLVATVAGYAADRIATGNGHGLSPTACRVAALEVADELEAIVVALRAPGRPARRRGPCQEAPRAPGLG